MHKDLEKALKKDRYKLRKTCCPKIYYSELMNYFYCRDKLRMGYVVWILENIYYIFVLDEEVQHTLNEMEEFVFTGHIIQRLFK